MHTRIQKCTHAMHTHSHLAAQNRDFKYEARPHWDFRGEDPSSGRLPALSSSALWAHIINNLIEEDRRTTVELLLIYGRVSVFKNRFRGSQHRTQPALSKPQSQVCKGQGLFRMRSKRERGWGKGCGFWTDT